MITEILFKLSDILGSYRLNKAVTQADFYCPFCKHEKRKLSINIETGLWHCWVCQHSLGSKGNIFSLLKKLNASNEIFSFFYRCYDKKTGFYIKKKPQDEELRLPKEFILLRDVAKSIEFRDVFCYLKERGVEMDDIARYRIGYCPSGEYKNRIVIPSYDKMFRLNYFVSRVLWDRSKLKYKNPSVSKNVISFEHLLDWNQPIILCEGYFDAIAIRRNAVPLMGKFLSDRLIEEIFLNRPKEIILCLDSDAIKDSISIYVFLKENGINVKICFLDKKDPSELGFKEVWKRIKEAKELNFAEIAKLKTGGKIHEETYSCIRHSHAVIEAS